MRLTFCAFACRRCFSCAPNMIGDKKQVDSEHTMPSNNLLGDRTLQWVCCSAVSHQLHSLGENTRLFSVFSGPEVNGAFSQTPLLAGNWSNSTVVSAVFVVQSGLCTALFSIKSHLLLIDLVFMSQVPPSFCVSQPVS